MEPNLTPAAPKRPLSKTVRRAIIGSTVAVVAGVGGVAAYAGGAYAAETPAPDASASASATPGDSGTGSTTDSGTDSGATTNQDAQRGPGGHGGPGGHRGGGFGGPGAVTSTAVVQAADGTITTEISADGEVTEVSSTSITLKGADGSQTVFAVPADVTLADTIVVGANVDARGTVADNVNTLSHVHVEGEKPAAPADGTAPAAPADGTAPAAPAEGTAPAAPADGTAPAAPTERPSLLHATSIVEDRDNEGQFVTRVMQTGEVTAVSDTSITVKSADGLSATYTLGTDVTTDAAVGDTVSVGGTQSGDTNTAERIGSGDMGLRGPGGPEGPGGHGGMGERGEKPADPADPATPADPADPADPAAPADSADPAAPASGATTGDTAPTGLTQNGANLPSLTSLI